MVGLNFGVRDDEVNRGDVPFGDSVLEIDDFCLGESEAKKNAGDEADVVHNK